MSPELAGRAVCADPKFLPLVDEAFRRPSSDAARRLGQHACGICPVFDACLAGAIERGEHGPWAGTTRLQREKATGRKPVTHNLHPFPARTTGVPA